MSISSTHGVFDYSIPNQSPKLVIVSIVFFAISTITIAVRLGWRWAHRQRGWDDVMALCAYAILLIMTTFGIISAEYGFGKQSQYILPTLSKALEYFYLYQICYKLLGGFTKLVFCFLYLRIFPQAYMTRIVIAVALISGIGSLAFAIGTVFQCLPVDKAWNHSIPGSCVNNTGFWYSHAAFNTFMDIVIYLLPIPMIRTLKLARGQKTGLISIFCLGAFVIAASIVRMVSLRSSATTSDPTWGSLDALMWTEIEGNTSVICCCMPALRVPVASLFAKITKRLSQSRSSSHFDKPSGAWAGPHQSFFRVGEDELDSPRKPMQCYHPGNDGRRGENKSASSGSKSEAWYERALRSLAKDDTQLPVGGDESQDELAKDVMLDETELPNGLPEVLELGAIYKTTEMHVSTSDVEPPMRDRGMSLQDFLKEG